MKLDIEIGRRAIDCRVAINGEDVTHSITGLEISAHVGELTKVKFTVLPSKESSIRAKLSVPVDGVEVAVSR